MSAPIMVPATLDAANRKKDRSVGLRFTTNLEISNTEFAVMDQLHSRSGWLLFAESELSASDVPDEPLPTEAQPKSKSKRLRASIFVRWQETPELRTRYPKFDDFYDLQMEKHIEFEKGKIPE